MTASPYSWENLQVHFENLMRRSGLSADKAKDHIISDCRTRRREIRALNATVTGTIRKFETAAFDQLRVEMSDGLLLAADRFEIRQRPSPAAPNLGPVTPMPDALKERFEAGLRELGGSGYIVSPSGSGFVMSPPLPPPAAPSSDSRPEPPKQQPTMTPVQRRKKVEIEAAAYLNTKDDLERVDRDHYKVETMDRFANEDPPLSEKGYYRALKATGRTKFGPKPTRKPTRKPAPRK